MNRSAFVFLLILATLSLNISPAGIPANTPDSESIPLPLVTDRVVTDPEAADRAVTDSIATDRGQLLYENHCTACHNDSVHSRNHGKAHSLAEIRQWVIRWSTHLELNWEMHDVDTVADFLNRRFYHLSTEN